MAGYANQNEYAWLPPDNSQNYTFDSTANNFADSSQTLGKYMFFLLHSYQNVIVNLIINFRFSNISTREEFRI